MKGTIFEIKRFAVHDGDGIRTTVFLKGCPLRCLWCHNPEGLCAHAQLAYYEHKCIGCGECVRVCPASAHRMENGVHRFDREKCTACGACARACLGSALTRYGKNVSSEELMPLLLEDKEFYENSGGGVTLSGGECLMQADFCAALLKALKEASVSTAVDTCGLVSKQALDKVMPYTDVFLYDVKAYNEDVHLRCTGVSNKTILENLLYLDTCGKTIEIRIPLVPSYNGDEIEPIARFLATLKHISKIRILAYHDYAGSKYYALGMQKPMQDRVPTEQELEHARERMASITGRPCIS